MINGQDGCTSVRFFIIQHSASLWRLGHKVLEWEVKVFISNILHLSGCFMFESSVCTFFM